MEKIPRHLRKGDDDEEEEPSVAIHEIWNHPLMSLTFRSWPAVAVLDVLHWEHMADSQRADLKDPDDTAEEMLPYPPVNSVHSFER